jgi:hypothetical protein
VKQKRLGAPAGTGVVRVYKLRRGNCPSALGEI